MAEEIKEPQAQQTVDTAPAGQPKEETPPLNEPKQEPIKVTENAPSAEELKSFHDWQESQKTEKQKRGEVNK